MDCPCIAGCNMPLLHVSLRRAYRVVFQEYMKNLRCIIQAFRLAIVPVFCRFAVGERVHPQCLLVSAVDVRDAEEYGVMQQSSL